MKFIDTLVSAARARLVGLWADQKAWVLDLWNVSRVRLLVTVVPLLLLAFCAGKAVGATVETVTPGDGFDCKRGTTVLKQDAVTEAECLTLFRTDFASRTAAQASADVNYFIAPNQSKYVFSKRPDCDLSDWGADTLVKTVTNSDGSKTEYWERVRTVKSTPKGCTPPTASLKEAWTIAIPAPVSTDAQWVQKYTYDQGGNCGATACVMRYTNGNDTLDKTFEPWSYIHCRRDYFDADPAVGNFPVPAATAAVCKQYTGVGSPPAADTSGTDQGSSDPGHENHQDPAAAKPVASTQRAAGYRDFRVRTMIPGTVPPAPAGGGIGAFRNPCGYSHMAFDDPILYPGQSGAAHLHVFFGNTSTDAFTTTEKLFAAGASTCAGGTANLSAYWIPAMIDTVTNKAQVPVENLFYYKRSYGNASAVTRSPPNGLRFIGGHLTTESSERPYNRRAHYECNADYNTRSGSILYCAPGSTLNLMVVFPSCWDGVNLEAPDGKGRSHMAYADGGKCPASHPVSLPEISLNVKYKVEAGQDTTKWRLSSDAYDMSIPGGYTMHADIWFAWDEEISNTWTEYCIRREQDCHALLLGDGRETY